MNLNNLDFKTAGFWPTPVKAVAYTVAFVSVLGISYLAYFNSKMEELKKLETQEIELRDKFKTVQTKANNLENLKEELVQINELIETLVTRLPNKNEIPELVVDVSQAAIANGLQTDLFQPLDETKNEFYAEKRVNVNFKGNYHQLGAFFSEVAKQPRLVSVVVDDMSLTTVDEKNVKKPAKNQIGATTQLVDLNSTNLEFKGSVRTYRYLSEEEENEIAEAAAAAEAAANKNKKKPRKTAKEAE